MKILVKKQLDPKCTAERFSMGRQTITIHGKMVKKLGLEKTLMKLAAEIVDAKSTTEIVGTDERVIGIDVHGITFTYILDPSRKER